MKKWSERDSKDKKYFLIKVIGSILFLAGGLAFALVSASMNGWSIVEMVKDPKVWLALLCVVGLLVMLFSMKKVK